MILNWIMENWSDVAQAALATIGAAQLIVRLTPTPKDDEILAKALAVLKAIGLNKPPEDSKR